ncbi:hypothetical protein [Actinokineospora bangkokensis]|uniref:SH3b domain-containing protein n=1 Tax=Actinokineospora bangkokensis TaxID=1193682 RepID=A0A1Q9LJQ3_9PSEU|nr:hypothetical protein [Actinokineospora bangkokensis]OLR92258.1 hypothetical protein BJP25_23375 [Actinokineospora bangkokensis]
MDDNRKADGMKHIGTVLALAGAFAITGATVGATGASASPAGAQSWHEASVGGGNSGGAVTLRDCYHPTQTPTTSCGPVASVPTGTVVHVVCQAGGQNIYGNAVWDYVVTPYGEGYMADYYLFTGYDGWIPSVDRC